MSNAWELFSVNTNDNTIQQISVDLMLEGSCLMPGVENDELYVISPNDGGIFLVDGCDGTESCETTLVAKTITSFKNVSSCALSGYDYGDGGVVIAAASDSGMYVATISGTNSHKSPPQLVQITGSDKPSKKFEGIKIFGDIGVSPKGGVPDGVEVISVAVSAGWTRNGGGLAVAASTVDHIYYTTSYDDEVPSSSEILDLTWRDEWSTGNGWSGGAVDWPPPKYGLGFQLRLLGESPLLWVGGSYGLQALDLDMQIFRRYNGANQNLPFENVTVVAPSTSFQQESEKSALWVGTTMGLTLREGSVHSGASHWRYMNGPRYLPGVDSTIIQVAVLKGDVGCGGCSGECSVPTTPSVLALTAEGLALINIQCWSLEDKASLFEDLINPRHDRYGLVGSCGLTTCNDLDTYQLKDSDNDGLWTSIYTSSQVLKAATLAKESTNGASPSADFNASIAQVQEHFAALKKLFDITGMTGSMARSFALYGEEPLGPVPGDDNKRAWYNSSTMPGWIWKGDTSSDEVCGHMFIYGLIAALVPESIADDATPTEEAYYDSMSPIRADAVQLIDDFNTELLNNGLTLIDPGLGEPTTWGRWDPATLNNDRFYSDERGTNSVQLLSFLRNAAVVTNNDTFDDTADQVKEQYGYGLNARNAKITTPGDINFSDDELLLLPYFVHLVLSDSAPIKDMDMVCSFARTWMEGVAGERSTLWATMHQVIDQAIFNLVAGIDDEEEVMKQWVLCGGSTVVDSAKGFLVEVQPSQGIGQEQDSGAVASDKQVALWGLRNWPLDLVAWGYTNSERADICIDQTALKLDIGLRSINKVLPQNERSPSRWNSNPYSLDSGLPGGTSEEDPGAFLLPYWMARYYELI